MADHVHCKCCNIRVGGNPINMRDQCCSLCRICDGMHGPALYARVSKLVALGRIDGNHGIAAVAMDDAWFAGEVVISPDGTFIITKAPKRWEVVAAWGKLGAQVTLNDVMNAAIAPYLRTRGTPEIVEAAKRDIRDALHAVGPDLQDIDIVVETVGDELVFKVTSKVPVGDATKTMTPDVEVPADILSRPRGSA
jgi:hypothetical protein